MVVGKTSINQWFQSENHGTPNHTEKERVARSKMPGGLIRQGHSDHFPVSRLSVRCRSGFPCIFRVFCVFRGEVFVAAAQK